MFIYKININCHLLYIKYNNKHCIHIVKMNRVFSSNYKISESSQQVLFHKINHRDSRKIVIPFMQVLNYKTMNFATFKPLLLQQSFTIEYNKYKNISYSLKVLDRYQTLYIILNLAKSYVFNKQSFSSY